VAECKDIEEMGKKLYQDILKPDNQLKPTGESTSEDNSMVHMY